VLLPSGTFLLSCPSSRRMNKEEPAQYRTCLVVLVQKKVRLGSAKSYFGIALATRHDSAPLVTKLHVMGSSVGGWNIITVKSLVYKQLSLRRWPSLANVLVWFKCIQAKVLKNIFYHPCYYERGTPHLTAAKHLLMADICMYISSPSHSRSM